MPYLYYGRCGAPMTVHATLLCIELYANSVSTDAAARA
jgi:hypothetical protein